MWNRTHDFIFLTIFNHRTSCTPFRNNLSSNATNHRPYMHFSALQTLKSICFFPHKDCKNGNYKVDTEEACEALSIIEYHKENLNL